MSRIFINLFPLWAITLSVIAYLFPGYFTPAKPAIIPLLALVMFGMGTTLTWRHFADAIKQPGIIGITVIIQFVFMPLLAFIISLALNLPEQLLIGMILVGSSAGGTASNVICYLARGNVALSILMTMTSTLCAVLLMPLLTHLYLNQMIDVPILGMMKNIVLIVFLPVLTGIFLNSYFSDFIGKLRDFSPVLSCSAIMIIIAIIVALNQSNLADVSLTVISAIVLHNGLGMLVGYVIARLLHYNAQTCRTVCIEVGMQNSGLSVALAIKFFTVNAALPGALFSIWHNISGSILAGYWRKFDARD